jgi:hypothetical protein
LATCGHQLRLRKGTLYVSFGGKFRRAYGTDLLRLLENVLSLGDRRKNGLGLRFRPSSGHYTWVALGIS